MMMMFQREEKHWQTNDIAEQTLSGRGFYFILESDEKNFFRCVVGPNDQLSTWQQQQQHTQEERCCRCSDEPS